MTAAFTQLDDLAARYTAGSSLDDLAGVYAVSTATVRRRLVEHGVTLRPRKAAVSMAHKTSAGRDVGPKRKVREAEEVECEGLPAGTHELTNDAGGRTSCRWCGETWVALDAGLRSNACAEGGAA